MATKTFEELKQLAIQIRDEKTNKQNTATRVGTAMLEHINKLEQDYYDKTKTDEELKERDDKLTELAHNKTQISDNALLQLQGYIADDGSIDTRWDNYVHSQFMSFTENDECAVRVQNNGSAVYAVCCFDAGFNFLGCIGNKGSNIKEHLSGKDAPVGTKFICINYDKSYSDNWVNILRNVKNIETNSSNMFDLLDGCYILDTGLAIGVFAALSISRFIPISNSKIYSLHGSSYKPTNYYNVNYYDSEFNWIGGYRENSFEIIIGDTKNPIPENAAYIRANVENGRQFIFKEIYNNEEELIAYNFLKENNGVIKSSDSILSDGYMQSNGYVDTNYEKYKHTPKIRVNKHCNKSLISIYNTTTGAVIIPILGLDEKGRVVASFGISGQKNLYVEIDKEEYPEIYYIVANITKQEGENNYISILEGDIETFDKLPYIEILTGAYIYADAGFRIDIFSALGISRFIPIVEDMVVCNTSYKITSYYNIVFYDENFQPISGYRENSQAIRITSDKIPEGAKYIRLNTNVGTPVSVYTSNDKYLISLITGGANSKLQDKTFWTIFDSLGASNQWQNTFVKLSGAKFYSSLNAPSNKPISWGGSNTGPTGSDCTLARAKNLVSYKDTYPIDYVFIENINDMQFVSNAAITGDISDKPWMQGENIVGHEIFESSSEANSYVTEHFQEVLSSIPSEKRKKGAYIAFPYKSGSQNAYMIKVISKATSNGTAYVIRDSQKFGIEVTTDMSIQDIIDAMENYPYGSGWSDVDNGDGSITIGYYTDTSSVITFDANGTGIQTEVTKTSNTGQIVRYFRGNTQSEWEDTENWSTSITLWSMYKGVLEYLKENLPNTLIYWFIPTRYGVPLDGSASYVKSDGTFDIDKYKQTDSYKNYKALTDCQKEVCEYYDIPVIDIEKNCNINLFNLSTFYTTNNVHPKQEGYDRWALTLYNILC